MQKQATKIPENERFLVLDSEFIDQHQVYYQTNKILALNNANGNNLFDNKKTNRFMRELSLNKESIQQLNVNLSLLSEMKNSELKTLIDHKKLVEIDPYADLPM